MRHLIWLLAFVGIWITSCESDEELQQENEIRFSVSKSAAGGTGSGRVSSSPDPATLLVTIKDPSGAIVVDRQKLALYEFGETFISLPLTLEVSGGGRHKLTEFLVLDADDEVMLVTPRDGSEMAHLVTDPLDIEFSVRQDTITTVKPQVLVLEENANPEKYGYGQFDFEVVKAITTVFSSFIRSVDTFELTDSHLKVEGIADGTGSDTTALWRYETDLAAKANVIGLKAAPFYRLTATKSGYKTWRRTVTLQNNQKVEILFEKEGSLEFDKIWNKHFGGSSSDHPVKTISTRDGGVMMVGFTFSNDHDINDRLGEQSEVWVLKLAASGEVQWSRTYNQAFNDHPYDEATSVTEFNDGSGYLITANSAKASSRTSGWLLKIDNEGTVIWKNSMEGFNFYSSTAAVTGSDRVILFGYAYTAPPPYNSVEKIAMEIDAAGNTIWKKRIFEQGFPSELQVKGEADSYLVVNRTQYLFKLNALGETEWKAEVPPLADHDRKFTVCIITPDGYVTLGTETNWQSTTDRHSMIAAKFTKNGEFVWKKNLATQGRKGFFIDATLTSSGNIRVVGGAENPNSNSRDAWIIEVSSMGDVVGQKFLRGQHTAPLPDCYFQTILPTQNDEYVITGVLRDTGNDIPGNYGSNDAWAMKIKF